MTYSGDRGGQVHHDARLGAGAQRVAADHVDRSWRGHVELAFCHLWHEEERNLDRAGQP